MLVAAAREGVCHSCPATSGSWRRPHLPPVAYSGPPPSRTLISYSAGVGGWNRDVEGREQRGEVSEAGAEESYVTVTSQAHHSHCVAGRVYSSVSCNAAAVHPRPPRSVSGPGDIGRGE